MSTYLSTMAKLIRPVVLSALGMLVIGRPAFAEFFQTDLLTYQNLIADSKDGCGVIFTSSGFMVLYEPKRTQALGAFDISALGPETQSLFVAYKSGSSFPEKIVLPGSENEFSIAGNLQVILSTSARLNLALTGDSPFATFTCGDDIIGILGSAVILNVSGKDAVAALEATRLEDQLVRDNLTFSFVNNSLQLGGRPVTSKRIGLGSQPHNICLDHSSKIYMEKDVTELLATSDKQLSASGTLAGTLFDNGSVVLAASNDQALIFDYNKNGASLIRMANIGNKNICELTPLDFHQSSAGSSFDK